MLWISDKDTALNYTPANGEGIFTVHRWFAQKSCPGDWLYNRMDELCKAVNNKLAEGDDEDMTQEKFNEMMNTYLESLANQDPTWEQSVMEWGQSEGLLKGDNNGRLMSKKFLTRGEFMQVLKRYDDKKN